MPAADASPNRGVVCQPRPAPFFKFKGTGNAEVNPVPTRVLQKEFYRLLEDQRHTP